MGEHCSSDVDTLVSALLNCSADQWLEWIAKHPDKLNLALIAALKQRSDSLLLAEPGVADTLTACALLIAQHLPGEPLAVPLACWARGNWAAYHDPHQAIQLYQQALADYRAAGEPLSVARLLSNLVFVCADCGQFVEAEADYLEAQAILARVGAIGAPYLLHLEINFGWLLHNQGRYDDALAAHDRALALAYQSDRPDKVAEIHVNRAVTLGMIGRLDEGEAALIQSRAVAERNGHVLTVARIDMNLGTLYTAQGRPAEALSRFQSARERFATADNQMELGTVLLLEAMLFERIGAWREARRSYTRAQKHFETYRMQPQLGAALVRCAAACRLSKAYSRAEQLLDQAGALWQALGQPLWQTIVGLEQAALALARHDAGAALALLRQPLPLEGNPSLLVQRDLLLADAQALLWKATGDLRLFDEARHAYEQSLSYARAQGERWVQRQALAGLGRLVFAQDPAAARAQFEAAAAHDDMMRQALSVEELKASFQAQAGDILPSLARLAAEDNQPLQALAYVWRAKGNALLDLLHATEERRRLPPAGKATIAEVRQRIAAQRWRLAREASDDEFGYARERTDPAINALVEQLFVLRRQYNQPAANDPASQYDPLVLLRHMDADVLIEYLVCDGDLLALRADRAGNCQAIWLAESSALDEVIERLNLSFLNVLTQPVERRQQYRELWLEECRPLLQRGYDLLIASLGALPQGARLLIAPCAPLYLLPFAALWDGQRYLIERYELELTPTGALLSMQQLQTARAAPLVIAASAEGQFTAMAAEVAAIQSALPDSVCLVDELHALDYLSRLQEPPQILHIAAHSVLRKDVPILSALQLAGGLLSVEQCYDLPLAGTQLVVLSACTTAAGQETGGALLAFQSAFFVAGAQHVLSSLWPIDDQASAMWMRQFYQFLARGLSPAAALRYTQRELLNDTATSHPAIWAAFICSRR
jgi:CHAT domain-containing protein/tetratricopeptide (TPR) repeat protein